MIRRQEYLNQLQARDFDVVIIGGGITGAGIMKRCVEQGWKTALIERNDYASGTSSRSAKMIHGGLRYLEYMQVKLVKEALEEREQLLTKYAHLVRPLPFVLPIYKSAFEKVKMKIGLSGYDALSGKSSLPGHQSLSTSDMRKTYPMLRQNGLKGGFKYYDAMTNDARLTNEVIMEANTAGGVALNYVNAIAREPGILTCRDCLSNQDFQVRSKVVISATGIWTDEFLTEQTVNHKPVMNPSKGVHLVMDGSRFPEEDVLLIPCEDDRFIWICPWIDGLVIIGATDTPFHGDLSEPGVTREDVDYLLRNCNRYLEGFQLKASDILSSFSGLRPLLDEEGEDDTVKVSRDYKIWWPQEDLLTIAGGKLTSFLSMADAMVRELKTKMTFKRDDLARSSKSGASSMSDSPALEANWPDLFDEALETMNQEEGQKNKAMDVILEAVIYFVRHQQAEQLSDVLSRRLALTYRMQQIPEAFIRQVAATMQAELGWNEDEMKERLEAYELHWQSLHDHLK